MCHYHPTAIWYNLIKIHQTVMFHQLSLWEWESLERIVPSLQDKEFFNNVTQSLGTRKRMIIGCTVNRPVQLSLNNNNSIKLASKDDLGQQAFPSTNHTPHSLRTKWPWQVISESQRVAMWWKMNRITWATAHATTLANAQWASHSLVSELMSGQPTHRLMEPCACVWSLTTALCFRGNWSTT